MTDFMVVDTLRVQIERQILHHFSIYPHHEGYGDQGIYREN